MVDWWRENDSPLRAKKQFNVAVPRAGFSPDSIHD
jgi:hypothetical protein